MRISKQSFCLTGSLVTMLSVGGICAVGAAGGTPGTGAASTTGTTFPGSMATSNGTNAQTNPSSIGGANTPPEQVGGTVGTGNVSSSNANTAAISGTRDYQNAVRLYGANSEQAKAASAQDHQARSLSQSSLTTPNGQTSNMGTFAPSLNSGSGASGVSAGIGGGAGMATGTGTGTGMGSTNGSPVAH